VQPGRNLHTCGRNILPPSPGSSRASSKHQVEFLPKVYKLLPDHAGFEVLSAVVMKSSIFWEVTPCSLLKINCRHSVISQKIWWAMCCVYASVSVWEKCKMKIYINPVNYFHMFHSVVSFKGKLKSESLGPNMGKGDKLVCAWWQMHLCGS
jgi:hypothetical protein